MLSTAEKIALGQLVGVDQFGMAYDAEMMRGEAEQLRKELLGSAYNAAVEDEEAAYAKLIYPFKR